MILSQKSAARRTSQDFKCQIFGSDPEVFLFKISNVNYLDLTPMFFYEVFFVAEVFFAAALLRDCLES